jgi:hypothetical protein
MFIFGAIVTCATIAGEITSISLSVFRVKLKHCRVGYPACLIIESALQLA